MRAFVRMSYLHDETASENYFQRTTCLNEHSFYSFDLGTSMQNHGTRSAPNKRFLNDLIWGTTDIYL